MNRKILRPWGSYVVLNSGKSFKTKLVEVAPSKRLSLQKHNFRSEHWVVVQGKAKVTNNRNILYLNENESTFISKGIAHRLENVHQKKILRIIEVQCGNILRESDIERIEDDYDRE